MKIIIASTPKTGNTWMANILSTMYKLRPVTLPTTFDATAINRMGSDWVSLQHYWPQPELLAWAKRHEAQFVTLVRHPGDVLVSLWHMVRNKSYDPNQDMGLGTMLMLDGDQMGEHSVEYVKKDFFHGLSISLDWMNSDESLPVRYEDLWRDPVATLTRLTDKIRPVGQAQIESAIDLCDIRLLRKLRNDPQGKVFRKGGPGGWRELPDDIVDVFRHHEPYPALFQSMGYTLDPHDPLIDAPAKPRVSTNPFLNKTKFNNGVEVPLLIIKLYLTLYPELKPRWHGSATETGNGSFFAWLNAPADADVHRRDNSPIITNLAHYIYGNRPDLQAVAPDLFGKNRHLFAYWFIIDAQLTYALDKTFIEPVRSSTRIISPSILEANNIVPSLSFLLRCKLSSWLKKVRAWRNRTR